MKARLDRRHGSVVLVALAIAACAAQPPREIATPPAAPAPAPIAAAADRAADTAAEADEAQAHGRHEHHQGPAQPAKRDAEAEPGETAPPAATTPPPPAAAAAMPSKTSPPERVTPATPAAAAARSAPARPAESAAPAPRPEAPAQSAERALRGMLRLTPGRGQRVAAEDFREAVIWFVPDGGGPVRAGSFTMNTLQKGFEPQVLAVPVGSTVRFPNGDPVLHNVYSDSTGNAFDLGLYASGEAPTHQFRRAGVVDVHCNVHRRMQAKIVVVESHHIGRVAADGRFEIAGVPAVGGRLVAWHPRGERVERRFGPDAMDDLAIEIPLTRPRAEAFEQGARR
jgi:plastocyanin